MLTQETIAMKNFLLAIFLLATFLISFEKGKAQNFIAAENQKEGSR
jgi:hypothetical protein